jgi:hypothetical protein
MRTESGLGFEATIAPNTTSTLAAEGSDQDGVGHYSLVTSLLSHPHLLASEAEGG